jgi:hypothetical protein
MLKVFIWTSKYLIKPFIEHKTISFLCFLLLSNLLPAQTATEPAHNQLQSFYEAVSQIYGTDPVLVNGTVYLENLGEIKGNPYFLSGEWIAGDIFVRERRYENQKMKYNIETDELILNTGHNDSLFTTIKLNRALVDSFNMGEHHFTHSRRFFPGDSLNRYFETIEGSGFTFLQTHLKELNKKYSAFAPGGNYSEPESQRFIFKNGKLFKINNKKEFYSFFDKEKKDIRKFLRTNQIKYRKANTRELKLLISYISELTQPL